MKCRHCKADLKLTFADLGAAPPSNSYLTKEMLDKEEVCYPLLVKVCEECWLVQTVDFTVREEFFSQDYSYFSSYSSTFLEHSKVYSEAMIKKLNLGKESLVVEVASNDGYLLQYFNKESIPCLGIEPTQSTANVSREKGIETITEFFGTSLAKTLVNQNKKADLMVANNVLAHVPDINDFVQGFSFLLKDTGVATFEFPHLLTLVESNAFDTIYHEHYSYLSLIAVMQIFEKNGLEVFDIEKVSTHGGSLRVFAQRKNGLNIKIKNNIGKVLEDEIQAGINSKIFYANFENKINIIRNNFIEFLQKEKTKIIAGYGAAAKGNTFLNYAKIQPHEIAFVVDKNPSKIGKFLPGSKIPIVSEEEIKKNKPDFIIIFPWNIREEIMKQLEYTKEWGCKFVTFIPDLTVV